MHYELELAKGIERMSTVCSIAHKRILSTYHTLGIPGDVVRDEYLIAKDESSINLVSNTVNDVNKMINLELINLGVRIATHDEIRGMVDEVRAKLAELIMILGKGYPAPTEPPDELLSDTQAPTSFWAIGIVAVIVTAILALIAVDVDN